jgi:hypothetical protein
MKNVNEAKKDKKEKLFDFEKEVGLGPSLFLMTSKSFACLFLVLAILNFPLIMFYMFQAPSIKNQMIVQKRSGALCLNYDLLLIQKIS